MADRLVLLQQTLQHCHLYSTTKCIRLCLARWDEEVNVCVQITHSYGLSPVWLRMCVSRPPSWANPAWHTSQLYGLPMCGLSAMWVRLCDLRLSIRANPILHTSHAYGLAPGCNRLCLARWDEEVNVFVQVSQTYGLSPVWVRLCVSRVSNRANPVLHTSHMYGLSPVIVYINSKIKVSR